MIYDVFLSYNQEDEEVARELNDFLVALGLNICFDPDRSPSSGIAELHENLRTDIDNSRCFALLHGPHCLGETQRKEADYAAKRASRGLDFRNVILEPCTDSASHQQRSGPYQKHYYSFRGSHFKIANNLRVWLTQKVHPIGEYTLCGFEPPRTVPLRRILQPDNARIANLDWQTYGEIISDLIGELERRAIRPDIVVGINEGGMTIASLIAAKLNRVRVGYLKHEGNKPRRVVEQDSALPRTSDPITNVLLVDSELKTGGALEAVLPVLKRYYPGDKPGIEPGIYYATPFAQLNPKHWASTDFPSSGSQINYADLLAATRIQKVGLKDIVFGGLFGEGRVRHPLGVR